MSTAILSWCPKKKALLKAQIGTGANLTDEDVDNGYEDYILYSVFKFGDIDIDEELDVEMVDSGQMLREETIEDVEPLMPDVYEMTFDEKAGENDMIILLKEDD